MDFKEQFPVRYLVLFLPLTHSINKNKNKNTPTKYHLLGESETSSISWEGKLELTFLKGGRIKDD